MLGTIATATLALAVSVNGGLFGFGGTEVARVPAGHGTYNDQVRIAGQARLHGHQNGPNYMVTPPALGLGLGFANGNPDGYGWVDYGTTVPLGADRTPDYFFRRQYTMPRGQMFLPQYYNAYVTRGQRYLPFAGGGAVHPVGGLPPGPSSLPMNPYEDVTRSGPMITPPVFNGRSEGLLDPSGGLGRTP